MLLKWLSHVLSGLLVLSLCGLIVSTVASQTIMSSRYLESQLSRANGYSRISGGLTDEVSQQTGLGSNPQVKADIQSIITPAVLKQKINTALNQLSLYYQGQGAAPTIDLTGLATQVQAVGVSLPAESALSQPIKLVPDSGTGSTVAYPGRSFAGTRTTTIITSVLLALALLAVSWRRQRYGALPNVLISVGVLIGLLALVLHMGPNLADHYIRFSGAPNAFVSLGRDLAENIVRDLARRFGIVAVICLVVGVIARIWIAYEARRHKSIPQNGKALKPVVTN
jgi:hypothetical protein